jgi:superfamily I DNA/RNA helicase
LYNGPLIDPPELVGEDIEVLAATDLPRQAKKIQEFVSKLLTVERIPSSSIVVLIADRIKRKDYEMALQRLTLPSGLVWKGIDRKRDTGVTLETVARFKGLEGDVLILWGLDNLPSEERRGSLYVGISRAKSILALCGKGGSCSDVLTCL